jgi:hypothetical protein
MKTIKTNNSKNFQKNRLRKKSQPEKVKTKLSRAEDRKRTVRLLSEYVPLCGQNLTRLSKLTGLGIPKIYNAFKRKECKKLKEEFYKCERVDHNTEMWHTKTFRLKNAVPKSDGSYKHLAALVNMPVQTVKKYVTDPRNELLKIALDERRAEVKAAEKINLNELLIEAISLYGADMNLIAGHAGLSKNYTYKKFDEKENTEARDVIIKVRAKERAQRLALKRGKIELNVEAVNGNPDFEIDSKIDSFLSHQIDFAYLSPDVIKHPALVGGFGSGKTMSIPLRWLKLIEFRISQGKKCDLMVLEPTNEMIRDIIIPTFDDFFAKFEIPVKYLSQKQNYTITYRGEKFTCLLRSADRPRSLTGKNLSDIIIDEFDRIPYYKQKQIWRECISRIRKTEFGSCAVVTTPEGYKLTHELWVEKNNKTFLVHKAKTKNNIYLPADFVENLYEQYDSKLAKQYLEGEFVNIESDIVYYCFDREVNVIADDKIPQGDDNRVIISFDFNVNPMCAVEIITHGKARYQVHEYKISQSNTKELCDMIIDSLQRRYENAKEMNVLLTGDASGKARSSSGDSSDFEIIKKCFDEAGFPNAGVYLENANPPVRERVNFVNAILEKKQFFIAESCKASVKDRELVSWKKGSGKFIIDKTDRETTHLSDAADYGLCLTRKVLASDDKSPAIVIYPRTRRYS